jgi:hypothetical protein
MDKNITPAEYLAAANRLLSKGNSDCDEFDWSYWDGNVYPHEKHAEEDAKLLAQFVIEYFAKLGFR